MELQINLTGTKEIIDKIKDMTKDTYTELENAVKRSAKRVEATAKKYAPVQFGFLRQNITSTQPELTDDTISCKVGAGDNVSYARDVEFGWLKGKKPRKPGKRIPFLRPAFDENYNINTEDMANAVKKTLK